MSSLSSHYGTYTRRPTRAPTWPRGLPATWLRHYSPPARDTRALPRGLSAASHPKLVPRATSPWPVRHVSRRHVTLQVKPLFAIFLIRNSIYKSNKNHKKYIKLQKFIFLKIQLLLISNFLHWITNFLLFNIMSFKIYLERRNQDDL